MLCFFWNSYPNYLRNFITEDMSISWNVVNKAYVFWLSFNLCATFWRSLDIGYLRYSLLLAVFTGVDCFDGTGEEVDCFGGTGEACVGGDDDGGDDFDYVLGAYFFYYFISYFFADTYYFFGYYGFLPDGFESGSISKNGFPTTALSPYATWNLVILPAYGALIYTVTFYV